MMYALTVVAAGFLVGADEVATSDRPAAGSEAVVARRERVEAGLLPTIIKQGDARQHLPLEDRLRFYKTPGFSVAVINEGHIDWARGYGVREAGTTAAVTTETVFQAASISKPIAAMVALRLVEQGGLDLDEDVNRKLVSWKLPENELTRNRKVSLRLLLSHRAGLTDNAGFRGAGSDQPLPTLREILESGKWTPAPVRVGMEPDSRFAYSGGGYCLVEQLLEDVSGKPFPVLARELVLEPLGMTNSSFEQRRPAEQANAARGHLLNGKRLPQGWNSYSATSAAGLWTTPTDLARFAIEIQKSRQGESNKVLSQRMTKEMLTLQGTPTEGDSKAIAVRESFSQTQTLGWGLGVGLVGQPPTRLYHTGSNPGYQCELQAYVKGGQGAVVMSNGAQGWRLGREVLGSIARVYGWAGYDEEPEVRKAAAVEPRVLVGCVGKYRLVSTARSNSAVSITHEKGRLFVQFSDSAHKVELYPESDNRFFSIEDAMVLTFVKDEAGAVSLVVSDQGWRAKRDGTAAAP